MTVLYTIAAFFVGYIVSWSVSKAQKKITNKKLEQSQKALRAKSALIANISHEIRTPMNGVMGLTNLLGETSLDTKQREYVTTIQHSCEALLAILNDVLDFSKIEAGKMKLEHISFSPEAIVHEVFDLFKVKAEEKKLKFEINIEGEIPKCIMGDPYRVREIVLNLVSNAIKYTEKGSVVIELKYVKSKEKLKDNEGTLYIAVKDTGIGISKSNLKLLFKDFSQIHSKGNYLCQGTGLGLAISRKLSHMMGDDLKVSSDLGKGSTFTLSLHTQIANEVGQGSPMHATGHNAEVDISHLKKLKVLVVEDNPVNLKVIQLFLEQQGIKASMAKTGQEAIQMVGTDHYDVVFMDLGMPDMDGLRVTAEIRKMRHLNPQPYIIAMTAAATLEDRKICLDAGMNDYIAKPYNKNVIVRILSQLKK